ncbi:unnamed protein product [Sphagnum jensenii]|uniref:Uncharacterized protein n=1 Tax=Sphagnum jensenii TaxID=128206 RepID=A0ABP0WG30_9BRYO
MGSVQSDFDDSNLGADWSADQTLMHRPSFLNLHESSRRKLQGCGNSISNPSGISFACTQFDFGSGTGSPLQSFPTGSALNFRIVGLIRDCEGQLCYNNWQLCNLTCACCLPYVGSNPGFQLSLSSSNSSLTTTNYNQYLNCSVTSNTVDATGGWNTSCNFTGWGLANPFNALQFSLTWSALNGSSIINTNVFITPGSVSLQACTWAWDKGINSFPVQSRWTLRILLNDAYNNSVSSANGADDSGNLGFQWVITFRNQADQSLVPAAIMPQPQVVDNLSNGYYSLVLISFVEGKYTITVANDKNQTVANMPASFQVTKVPIPLDTDMRTHLNRAIHVLPSWTWQAPIWWYTIVQLSVVFLPL